MFTALSFKAKIGIGLLVSYTSYAAFVSATANREISRRSRIHKNNCCHDDEVSLSQLESGYDSIREKYKSLTIAGRFENPFEEYRIQTLFEFFLTRILELFEGKSRGDVPTSEKLREILPIYKPDFELLFNPEISNELPELNNRLTFTWLGQSCSFIQIGSLKFLTDPIFENYLINSYIGPKRITPSPCKLEELPIPDFILVSHNHPDHLDDEVIKKINNKSTWIVPLGIRKYLARKGVHNIIELDWWDKVRISDKNNSIYEIACTPAMHWSGRNLFDSNQSLWCSFMILKNEKPIVFHAGDTGYVNDLFQKISEKFGSGVVLAMLPMGQYCPQWHQKPRHINPEECFKIMNDLKAKKMVGIHWGTFVLSSEYFLEPKLKLEELTIKNNKENQVFVPKFGKTYIFDISKDNENHDAFIEVRNGKSILVK